jgi:hypothetical protein
MRVDLYTLCWNDIAMLDFFFRHYEPWVDRFFIFDDRSDDGTREYLEHHSKVSVATLYRSDAQSWVLSARKFYNTCWLPSRGSADWVVITNIDEHLYHPAMRTYLKRCTESGVTAIPALGYQMISTAFPPSDSVLCCDVRSGAPWHKMSKIDIFNPNAIEAINYGPGRHRARLKGAVFLPDRDEVLNLHYKYLGVDYVAQRHKWQSPRLLEKDKEAGWGHRYFQDTAALERDVAEFSRRCVDVGDRDRDHDQVHTERRWWRSLPDAKLVEVKA